MDFYVTLTSNASADKHPDNSPGNFKVDLSHKHELGGVWELGLTEIQFTNPKQYITPNFDLAVWVGVYDVAQDLHKFRPARYVMSDAERRLLSVEEMEFTVDAFVTAYVRVPARAWRSEHEFGDALARRLKFALNRNLIARKLPTLRTLRYERNESAETVEFKTDEDKVLGFTTEHESVMRMLGLAPISDSMFLEAKKFQAYLFSEGWQRIHGGFPSLETMFVYSSVCKEQHVGDGTANLLRAVPVTVERGKRQCERYSPATYARLSPGTLASIDVQILDKTGAEVHFGGDSVVVMQLHVRKRRSALGWY